MTTRYYAHRFGGGLPNRPNTPSPPTSPAANEARYVQQLLDAYSDNLGRAFAAPADLASESPIADHFNRSRESFYSAESLRNFSRDTLPEGAYDSLKDEFYDGLIDTAEANHTDGLERVRRTCDAARALQVAGHALAGTLSVRDRAGVCHQLANDDRLTWVPKP